MIEIKVMDCIDSDCAAVEARLSAKGYTLTSKNSEEELELMEYMKSSCHGDAQPFEEPRMWTIRYRVQ